MKKARVLLLILPMLIFAFAPASAQEATDHWWNDRVFYELFVRSFYDSNGDGIGDLQGVIQKLDYLNDGDPSTTTDLGVTGLWLMPIMESPSYHGYDVTNYYAVDTDYGTNDDFRQLIAAAHQRGIAVIVDLPVNHTSNAHPWFHGVGGGQPNLRRLVSLDGRPAPLIAVPGVSRSGFALDGRCYYAIFWEGMPDLNYENPAVTTQMDDIARYWLQDMGADGFRLDALQHIVEDGQNQVNTDATHAWANAFHQYIDSVSPDALTVGEVDSGSFVTSTYVPDAADLVFEFDLAGALLQSANQGSSAAVATLQNRAESLYPPGQYAAFLTNHDQNRTMNTLRGDANKAKVAADLLLTQPGVPFIYYGEEIGMSGIKPDERIRTPMQWDGTAHTGGFTSGTPWEVLQNDADTLNVAAETDDPDSLLSHYRDLIHLREAHPALAQGDFTAVDSGAKQVYSFLRRGDDETLLVVINLSGKPVSDYGLTLDAGAGGGQVSLIWGSGDLTQPEIDADGGFTGYVPLAELAPYSLTVIGLAQ